LLIAIHDHLFELLLFKGNLRHFGLLVSDLLVQFLHVILLLLIKFLLNGEVLLEVFNLPLKLLDLVLFLEDLLGHLLDHLLEFEALIESLLH
jgi:hypothetical protein